jgi:hypothetical protein
MNIQIFYRIEPPLNCQRSSQGKLNVNGNGNGNGDPSSFPLASPVVPLLHNHNLRSLPHNLKCFSSWPRVDIPPDHVHCLFCSAPPLAPATILSTFSVYTQGIRNTGFYTLQPEGLVDVGLGCGLDVQVSFSFLRPFIQVWHCCRLSYNTHRRGLFNLYENYQYRYFPPHSPLAAMRTTAGRYSARKSHLGFFS